jgi:hypothetical protein
MPDYNLTIQRRVTQQAIVIVLNVPNEDEARKSFEQVYRIFPDTTAFENLDINSWPEIVHIEEVK